MLVRRIDEVSGTTCDVQWGNGRSIRLLTRSDERGFTLTDTYIAPGSESLLSYDRHIEACYCVEGSGEVESGGVTHPISVGTLYAPSKGERHILRSTEGMRLICVFSPALWGTERHHLGPTPSGY
jgi:L-ectoine synthase